MSGVANIVAKKRALAAGFGTNAKAVRYLNQDFATLRAECLSAGKLFCDPTFPAAPESLGFNELGRSSFKVRGVTWKRPTVRNRVWVRVEDCGGVGGGVGCLLAEYLEAIQNCVSTQKQLKSVELTETQ